MSDIRKEALTAWKADPCLMVRNLFHAEPDAWQVEALNAFADPSRQRIALQACAGPGKTTALAWMCWNFLLCYSDGLNHPNGAAMSVDAANLKNNLWKELSVWRDRAELLTDYYEMTAETIFFKQFPKTWFLAARTWSKSANQEEQGRTLSGLHAKSIFYAIDESGDIGSSVLRSAEQGLSNCAWGKIATAGNPTSLEGLLHTAVSEQSHLWTVIRITGDPDDPRCFARQNKEWAREQIAAWGRDNPWVMAYILGKFPPSSLNALLGPDDVRAAIGRHLTIDQYDFAQKRIGGDVARFGDDSTVLFPRQGLAAFQPVEMRNARTDEIAARWIKGKLSWGSEVDLIDDTGGWGAGVIDAARLGGVTLIPVNASQRPDDPRFYNKRAETTFRAAAWVKAGGALPNVPSLVREAVAASVYTFKDGKFLVLEKAQVKVNLSGKSPDFWDALCLTFALVDMPGRESPQAQLAGITGANHAASEWDPWAADRE